MDDKIFFAALLYIVIAVSVMGFMPSDFYTGGQGIPTDIEDLRNTVDTANFDADSTVGQISFFRKVVTFMFFTWGVEGIPAIPASIIFMINLFSLLISIVWSYDKIRGIGG